MSADEITAYMSIATAFGAVISAVLLLYQLHLTKKPMFNNKLERFCGGTWSDYKLSVKNVSQNQAQNVLVEIKLFETDVSRKKVGQELSGETHPLSHLNPGEMFSLNFPLGSLSKKHHYNFETKSFPSEAGGKYEILAPKRTLRLHAKVVISSKYGFLPFLDNERVLDDYYIEWLGWENSDKPKIDVWHERDGISLYNQF